MEFHVREIMCAIRHSEKDNESTDLINELLNISFLLIALDYVCYL